MRQSKFDCGSSVNNWVYQCVTSKSTLENINESDYRNVICFSLLEDVPAVKSDALLETVIPEVLKNELPLPVLNEEVEGYLCRTALVDLFSGQFNEDKATFK